MKNMEVVPLLYGAEGAPVWSSDAAAVSAAAEACRLSSGSLCSGPSAHGLDFVDGCSLRVLLKEGGAHGREALAGLCRAFEDMQGLHAVTLVSPRLFGSSAEVVAFCRLHSYFVEWNEGGRAWSVLQIVTAGARFSVRRKILRDGEQTTARAAKNSLRRFVSGSIVRGV